ncbi:MAG: hypothetical protein QM817_27255 [Archangium sp.]
MRFILCAVLCCASACSDPVLRRADSFLVASPTEIDFGVVAVGSARRLTLTLDGNATVSAATSAPFFVAADQLTAPATLEVSFAPDSSGPFEGNVLLGDSLVVPLRGVAITRESCTSSEPCIDSTWSETEARCVLTPREEGAACTTACIANGRCVAGTCAGEFARCDDSDACTTDACDDSRGGCVHSSTSCASADPCQAPRCDPTLGCVTSQVDDGTSCGERDCSTAHVCIAGACVVRSVPDGTSCGLASYCQAAGTCSSGTCVQPPARELQLAWRYRTTQYLDFPALADDAFNFFWFECVQNINCELVSADMNGAIRYRTPIGFSRFSTQWRRPREALLVGALLVFGDEGVLEARRHVDGSLVWRTVLPPRVVAGISETRSLDSIASDGLDALYVAGAFQQDGLGGDYEVVFSRLNLQTGALEWDQLTGPSPLSTASISAPSVVVDASGQPVVSGQYRGGYGRTRGLTPQGDERWSTSYGPIALGSVIGSRIFHSNNGWFDAQGAAHPIPRFQNSILSGALDTNDGVVLVGLNHPRVELENERDGWQKVPLLDFGSWPPWVTPPRLNARGEVSFIFHRSPSPKLYDFSPRGAPIAVCPFSIPNATIDTQSPVLELPGLVVMTDSTRKNLWAWRR